MDTAIRVRTKLEGDLVQMRVLISHPMETGLRKDDAGQVVPAHFIELVSFVHKGRTILYAQWGPAVSRNPYLSFKFRGAGKGDKITISWVDNHGESWTDEAVIE
jgi:sulfur-oxidizing protein SoxZ